MRKYAIGLYLMLLAVVLPGCESWLDVQPYDKISEKELYSTPQGFRNAINGVYIDLNQGAIYGKSLTANWMDVMAQLYEVGPEHGMTEFATYRYDENTPKSAFTSTWNMMYKQIGNMNLFLSNIDASNGGVLSPGERDMLKGEALALRALAHFDLFRLFGPVYAADSTVESLPYYESYDGKAQGLLVATEFKNRIFRDLDAAEALLANDPVVKEGPMMTVGEDGGVINRYRGLRLNYYAVLALQARVALYVNMPDRALAYATRVIEETKVWFPFAVPQVWVNEPENPDRMLSSECLFSLQNTQRNDLFRNCFESTLAAKTILSPRERAFLALYEPTDWRLRSWWEAGEPNSETGLSVYSLLKHRDVADKSKLFNTVIPMLRRSEAHYIAAEVYSRRDLLAEARRELNAVRYARGLVDLPEGLTREQLEDQVYREYVREFYGEGQLFFYYKRKNIPTIVSGTGGQMDMTTKEYVIPLPESELKFR